jgi:hypothetical protein
MPPLTEILEFQRIYDWRQSLSQNILLGRTFALLLRNLA